MKKILSITPFLIFTLGLFFSLPSPGAEYSTSLSRTFSIRFKHCDEDASLIEPLVHLVIQESLLALHTLNPHVEKKLRKRLTKKKLVFDCSESERLDLENAAAEGFKPLFSPYTILINPTLLKAEDSNSKNNLLHEILHFSKIDNNSTSEHNQVIAEHRAETDSVYACAESVYPSHFKLDPKLAEKTCSSI